MRDPAATAERQQTRRQGLVASVITLPFRLLSILVGSLLFSIVMECVGMHLVWPEQGWRHSQRMFHYELNQISTHFTHSAVVQEPGRTARWLTETAYEWVFVKTGLFDGIRNASAQARAASQTRARHFQYYLSRAYVWIENYLIAAAFTTLTLIVRLLVLVLTLPLFILAIFVGLVDGLVRRDVRRFGAGRESGFVYHRVKASVIPLAVLPGVIYLTLPVSVHPLLVLLPSATSLGLAVNIMAGSFKKYL